MKPPSVGCDNHCEFVTDYLRYVYQAIQKSPNYFGYHMWSCMDNWSWTNACKNRYGFI
ncbi:family 1 glycosylhydrolase [Candidatus Enterenecus avicola]